MKAIKKAYGKAKWIDTRHSRHYLHHKLIARLSFNTNASMVSGLGMANYNNMLRAQFDDEVEKKAALADCAINTVNALKELSDKYSQRLIEIAKQYGVRV